MNDDLNKQLLAEMLALPAFKEAMEHNETRSAWTKDKPTKVGWYWYRNEEIAQIVVRVNYRYPGRELLAFMGKDSVGRPVASFGEESEWQPVPDPRP